MKTSTVVAVMFWICFGLVMLNFGLLVVASKIPQLNHLKSLFFANMLCGALGAFINWIRPKYIDPKE